MNNWTTLPDYRPDLDRLTLEVARLADAQERTATALEKSFRPARRDKAKRAACGCDLTGMAPPAVHIVDRHEEKR